jgi:uncharacterized membrane protein YGL010W
MLSSYFDLKKSFPFYGAFHSEVRNQIVHVIFVPVIFATSLTFGSFLSLGPVSLADIAAVFYAVSFIKMEPLAGLLYAPVIAAMHYAGTKVLVNNVSLALTLHILGWVSQIFAHVFFEKNRPAFLTSVPQSLHAAVFFVWLEVLFALGYKPSLYRELQSLAKAKKIQLASSKSK